MTLLTPHLTKPQGEQLAIQQELSVPGMAFWALTGPEGRTCRECALWGSSKRFKREGGELLPRRCTKFTRMMGGASCLTGVPHTTPCCKYFEPREAPPSIVPEPRKKEAA